MMGTESSKDEMIRRYCEVWYGWWRICRVDLVGLVVGMG